MGGWIEENTRETGNCRGIDFQSYLIPEKSTMTNGGVKYRSQSVVDSIGK